jgi:hypothetical protein
MKTFKQYITESKIPEDTHLKVSTYGFFGSMFDNAYFQKKAKGNYGFMVSISMEYDMIINTLKPIDINNINKLILDGNDESIKESIELIDVNNFKIQKIKIEKYGPLNLSLNDGCKFQDVDPSFFTKKEINYFISESIENSRDYIYGLKKSLLKVNDQYDLYWLCYKNRRLINEALFNY